MTLSSHPPLFGRRMGRPLTPAKKELLTTTLPLLSFSVPENNPLSLTSLFPTQAPLHLEIGFGTGHHLLSQLLGNPEDNFIGCEPYMGGIAAFLKKMEGHSVDLARIKIYTKDGQSLLHGMPPHSCTTLFVLFPDPWPKKRHLKRRFLNQDTLAQIFRVLTEGGIFTFASDIEDYFEQVLKICHAMDSLVLETQGILENTQETSQRPLHWPLTRFEGKAHREGRICNYASFKKKTEKILDKSL